jgi:hypothetical protein
MYSLTFNAVSPVAGGRKDRRTERLLGIAELHEQVVGSRDLLYCSPAIRALIEVEIPLLLQIAGRTA